MIKGYKVFDSNWTCRGFQYKVGETFSEDVIPTVCERGFHFCEKAADCFNYYKFDSNNKVAEVVALGDIDRGEDKSCTNKIQIVREIPWTEVLEIVNTGKECTGYGNTGNWNSGDWNSGDYNSGNYNSGQNNSGNYNSGNYNYGYRNSGYHNAGNWNSGNNNYGYGNSGSYNIGNHNSGDKNSGSRNSGDYNSGHYNGGNYNTGDYNTGNYNTGDFNTGVYNSGHCNSGDLNKCNFSNGCFNTVEPKIYLFNKPSEWTYEDWEDSAAYSILSCMLRNGCEYILWRDMSDKEREEHPEAKTTGGDVKRLDFSKYATTWWKELPDNEKAIITSLPNFDKEIFKEIMGINIDE